MPCPSTPIITACCSLSSLGATWHCPKPLPPITLTTLPSLTTLLLLDILNISPTCLLLPAASLTADACQIPWLVFGESLLCCHLLANLSDPDLVNTVLCHSACLCLLLTAYCLLLHSYTTCWYNLPFLTPSVSNIFSHIPHILHIPHIPTSDNIIPDSWPSFLLLTLLNSHVWSIYSLHWHFSLTWILTPHEYNCFSQIPSLTTFLYWSNLFALVVLSWSSIPALHISYNILHLPCLLTFLPCLTLSHLLTLTHSYSLLLTLTHLANLNTSATILPSPPDVSHHSSSLSLQLIYPVPSAPAAYWIPVTGPALFDLAACSSHIYLVIILPSDIQSISIFCHLTSIPDSLHATKSLYCTLYHYMYLLISYPDYCSLLLADYCWLLLADYCCLNHYNAWNLDCPEYIYFYISHWWMLLTWYNKSPSPLLQSLNIYWCHYWYLQ